MLHLKPVGNVVVRDPVTTLPLAIDGDKKPDNPYWRRRLRDGDCVVMTKADLKAFELRAKAASAKNTERKPATPAVAPEPSTTEPSTPEQES